MAIKKRGLGRGLEALLSSVQEGEESSESPSKRAGDQAELQHMSLNLIERGRYQPRRDMEPQALEELANSIRRQGVMQPIVVRPIDSERYEIIAGERRWRASQMAGLLTIPVIIRDVPDEAAIAMALIENIQRENLNPMEEAIALSRLQEEFELTQSEVAEAVGKSRSTIANLLRLLALHEDVKILLEHGDLDMGHARALLALQHDQQLEAAHKVVARALSVRETESLVKKMLAGETIRPNKVPVSEEVKAISQQLSSWFAAPVAISTSAQGKGKISIKFDSEDQLNSILSQLEQAKH